MRKATLAEMRRLAKRRRGKCISGRYINSRTPLWWSCRFGHRWRARPTNVTEGHWCPNCAYRKRLTLREMRALAASRGSQCVSVRYINNETKLRWRCASGHEWEAAPGLVKGGRWCPHCSHVARLSLKAMTDIAISRGGQCLSTQYVNVEAPLWWRCQAGHAWMATPKSIRRGSWCPQCVHNQRLQLEEMQQLARERGGRCLSRTYLNNRHPLLWECQRGHRWQAMPCNVKSGKRKRGTWCLECYNLRRRYRPRGSIEEMKALARSRGGICLSKDYRSSKAKLLWQCDHEHRWRATPDSIVQGSWCPACARNQRLTLRDFRALAASKGGKCLSRRYVNKATPLQWQCARKHRWFAQPGRVKRGTWCPQCANLGRRSPLRVLRPQTRIGGMAVQASDSSNPPPCPTLTILPPEPRAERRYSPHLTQRQEREGLLRYALGDLPLTVKSSNSLLQSRPTRGSTRSANIVAAKAPLSEPGMEHSPERSDVQQGGHHRARGAQGCVDTPEPSTVSVN